jgi:TatD DNase family protein
VPLRLADTHAHLADPLLFPRVDSIVESAVAAGVTRILTVGTDLQSSRTCVALAERFSAVYAAVGIHPHEVATFEPSRLSELRSLAQQPKVVALGEIGLDYFRDYGPRAQQLAAFRSQLELASELGLPVVVHNREAGSDVLELIAAVERPASLADRAGVLHCFTGSIDEAARAQRAGFLISFAGNLTYKKADNLRAVAARVPLDVLLTETDSPYLSPEGRRGRTNEPSNVFQVAEVLAQARQLDLQRLATATSANARRLFGWG